MLHCRAVVCAISISQHVMRLSSTTNFRAATLRDASASSVCNPTKLHLSNKLLSTTTDAGRGLGKYEKEYSDCWTINSESVRASELTTTPTRDTTRHPANGQRLALIPPISHDSARAGSAVTGVSAMQLRQEPEPPNMAGRKTNGWHPASAHDGHPTPSRTTAEQQAWSRAGRCAKYQED